MAEEQNQSSASAPEREVATLTGILITILVALIAGGGVWAYYNYKVIPDLEKSNNSASQTAALSGATSGAGPQNGTANWETYLNSTYHYSIKYPQNFYVCDWLWDAQTGKKVQQGQEWLFIDKNKIAENQYLSESEYSQPYFMIHVILLNNFSEIESGIPATSIKNWIEVAGEKALKVTFVEPSELNGTYSTSIIFNHGNNGYVISWKNSDGKGIHDSEIDQMLTTFKFTE